MRNIWISIGIIIGVQIGWAFAMTYSIDRIQKRENVMTINDYSRLRELEVEFSKSRFLFF